MFSDYRKDAFQIGKYVIVPEAQDSKAVFRQAGVPLLVPGFGFGVLAAVKLDDDPPVKGDEVNDISFDGLLAPESGTFHLAVAQMSPKMPFRIGDIGSQFPGTVLKRMSFFHGPSCWKLFAPPSLDGSAKYSPLP